MPNRLTEFIESGEDSSFAIDIEIDDWAFTVEGIWEFPEDWSLTFVSVPQSAHPIVQMFRDSIEDWVNNSDYPPTLSEGEREMILDQPIHEWGTEEV